MLQPLLGQMLNDKDIDVSVQKFTVANDEFDPNRPIAEDNQETKIVEKFVIKNSDGSIDRTVGMEDLANITDAVNLFAGTAENFASISGAAKKLLSEERAIKVSELDITSKEIEIENKILDNISKNKTLQYLDENLKAEIAKKQAEAIKEKNELRLDGFEKFDTTMKSFQDNLKTAQSNLRTSYVEKGGDKSLITNNFNTPENRKFFSTDKVESVIQNITNRLFLDTQNVVGQQFLASKDKDLVLIMNNFNDFSSLQG